LPLYYFLYYQNAGVADEITEGNLKTEDEVLLPDRTSYIVRQVEAPTPMKVRTADGEKEVSVHVVHLYPDKH
jgi:hypothetical protein